ncbi:hydra actinoporin-like toxin 4 [Hydra vulgaris]|uniref:Hydra actinoporin-like toxin 4 n=1 Tax=Hydra vulgaris TaxID=6087 RepID=ACTL4_HYDVU|nr:RecName: Full=Hydra actinoporin-like toxin 4; Short=HALT-4; AltName: Full=Alpha-pore-forming toxin; Short=alpha-PFT; AltName: Full=DELTA-hydritoxin-Hma1d; Short=DELTA-HYTX-Hma1d; Flags: Precursor [Hydra vulgaris]
MLLFKLIVCFFFIFAIGANENKKDETSGENEPSENADVNSEASVVKEAFKKPASRKVNVKPPAAKPPAASKITKPQVPPQKKPPAPKQTTTKKPLLANIEGKIKGAANETTKYLTNLAKEMGKEAESALKEKAKEALTGLLDKADINGAFNAIASIWKNNENKPARYWKCAVENLSEETLVALGTTPYSGNVKTVLSDIPPQSTGVFVWESDSALTGAAGVVHYQLGDKILNIMASDPYDWTLYGAWANVRVSDNKETFDNLYSGKNGAQYPTKAGNWGIADGVKFFLTNNKEAEFQVIFSG